MLQCYPEVDVVPLEIETVVTDNTDKNNAGRTTTEEVIEDFLPQCSAVIEIVLIEKVVGKENDINRENEGIKSTSIEL